MQNIKETLKKQTEMNSQNLVKGVKRMRDLKDDEYLKDDMIYCKKCNEHKLFVGEILGVERTFNRKCQCDREADERQRRIDAEIEHMAKIKKLQDASLLGERYKNAYFKNCMIGNNETFDNAYARCKRYCENSDEILKKGYGMYLWGDKGTGKTYLTACMANELINQYKVVLFTNFFEISKSIRATFKGNGSEVNIINKIADVDFLFIDDLGTEIVTKDGEDNWLQEKIFEIINKRYNNMKPTIFSSNYSLQQLVQERGLLDKTVDRILEMSTAIMKFEGKSQRSIRIDTDLF